MSITYIRRDFLRDWSIELGREERERLVAKTSRVRVSATFLSHSSQDSDILPAAIKVLENHGADVYIDKKDPELPPYTSKATASALRERISSSRKFVLLASTNSKDSRWVPWELGIADGYRKPRNVAIFPSVENTNNTSWTHQEYLGVYDRIVFGDHESYSRKIWMVLNPENNQATELGAWLAR